MRLKLLFGINGFGHGHISRATELIQELQKQADVDVVISGNSEKLTLPFPVKHYFKGFYFSIHNGEVSWLKTIYEFSPIQILKDMHQLPLDEYDYIITDFEPITALAARFNKKKCIHISNQCSQFSPKTPKLNLPLFYRFLDKLALMIFRADHYIGFHYLRFDNFIYPPIIRRSLTNPNHLKKKPLKPLVLVYLPCFEIRDQINTFNAIQHHQFIIFHHDYSDDKPFNNNINVSLSSINTSFDNVLLRSTAVITHAGFSTTSEALFLKKPLLCIPLKGQHEQTHNAMVLKKMGVRIIGELCDTEIRQWLQQDHSNPPSLTNTSTEELTELIMSLCLGKARDKERL